MDMSSMSSNMPGMTMTDSMPSSTASATDCSPTGGMDMSNDIDPRMDLLMTILDDTELQVIANFYAVRYWYGVIVIIGLAALLNVVVRLRSRSRMRSAAASRVKQATPPSCCGRMIDAITSAFRKLIYAQISPTRHSNLLKVPPLGITILLFIHLAFVLALEFVNQDIPGDQHRQAIGIRAGWLTITQLPLLILLSGKINIIGLITGVGYERLNVLHRWVARTMLLTATLHMGYQQALWNSLGLLQLEWNTDTCPPTGIKAYAFLLWLNLSTLAPIRNLWYEFFVIQHILTFFGLIICIMLHLPSTALYSRIYVWIPIGIYLFERTLRTLRYAYNNLRPGRATLIQLTGGVTKVIVSTRQLKDWSPGSFVLLSLPRFGLGQSHPATVASIPSSHEGKLVLILRAHRGFTSRIHANESTVSLHGGSASSESPQNSKTTHLALIDGPYGGTQLDFASYSSVLLIAGSTGVTFTLPVLLDLALRAEKQKPLVKHVTFIWAVKTSACTSWIDLELKHAGSELQKAGIELGIRIFVTADEEFVEVEEGKPFSAEACHCDKGNEECSCISPFPKLTLNAKPNVLAEQIKTQERTNEAAEETRGQELLSYTSRCSVATIQSGRPDLKEIIKEAQGKADGEIGVAICGPVELTAETRRVVAGLDWKGGSIYLHAESFGW